MKKRKKKTKKLVFIESWDSTKYLNICNFYFRIYKKMEHVDKNRIHNNIYKYGIPHTEENFNKIGKVIKKRKFYIYRTILYIVDNC